MSLCALYCIFAFTYIELQHGHVVRNPKKESHMVQLLSPMLLKYTKYLKYLNYLKFTIGKCCHFFCEWFFFRFVRKWHNTIKIDTPPSGPSWMLLTHECIYQKYDSC